ncbi:MAG TPA: peptidylprolyl isomerase [Clostridia bacterium]|nr:peptidylprolyl isomerase [Clostridia bacterium]
MKLQFCTAAVVLVGISVSGAQVASHAPTGVKAEMSANAASAKPGIQTTGKAVARVNGAVLTDRDLLRQMYAIFPYARQHNGFPKDMEPQIRQGALDMIIFEELLYQEAKRRNVTIPPARLAQAEANFRKQFPNKEIFQGYMNVELGGSKPALRELIRRSLLIESMLRTEITAKSTVTPAQAKAYYDKNPSQFKRPEMIHIQSISILPPNNVPDVLKEARVRAEAAAKQAKNAKSYRAFGLLAEQMSDDDYRVNMGDHKPVPPSKLPPEIVKAAMTMKPGDVSDLIQLGNAYTIFRLQAHQLPGKVLYAEVKAKLRSDLEKEKTQNIRATLGDKLRKNAKIEKL